MPLRSSRRNYNRVSSSPASSEAIDQSNLDEPLSPSSSFAAVDNIPAEGDETEALAINQTAKPTPSIHNEISVVLLDGAQTKFVVKCDPMWKVSEFKSVSASVTKVPPQSQRLIHMGKLLQDEKTLDEFGINENDKIVHLFPKPNVVINDSASSNGQAEQSVDDHGSPSTPGRGDAGAHVPQIILDAEEASRRSQILILSSQEIFEAQHRVKIFSFLLMIISSMELLTLLTLFVGQGTASSSEYGGEVPPGNPTDAPPSASNEVELRTWQPSDYVDTAISVFGFYVSLLGIKATTENTLQMARRYLGCLILVGIASNSYYYFLNIRDEETTAQERNFQLDQTSKYSQAFLGILPPLIVWVLCILRAYQFQSLIREAEEEAEQRTRGFVDTDSNGNDNSRVVEGTNSLPYGSGERNSTQSASSFNDLELQVDRGVSS
mmetsp:Transcript_30597/g.61066  ORF Transcript_30597/g.61066 Transcript_30597/m.61066 type:complete len:436 (+) Transcript_30597:132-1439(+)